MGGDKKWLKQERMQKVILIANLDANLIVELKITLQLEVVNIEKIFFYMNIFLFEMKKI